MSEAEVAQFLAWKNKIRHNLLKSLQKGRPKAADAKFQIRKVRWLVEHGSVENMAAAWEALDPARRKRIWPNIMSSALRAFPEKALSVLQATLNPLPPGYAVQDTVHFLALWQRSLPKPKAAAHAGALADTVIDVLGAYSERDDARLVFRQNTLYHIGKFIPVSMMEELYTRLMRHNHKLHPNTLLQMASRFAQDASTRDYALQIATAVANAGGSDLTSPAWASLCTTLLSPPTRQDDKDLTTPTIDTFEMLLQHGLVPNLINYTALVRGLCATGRIETAWDIAKIMENHEISPDSVFVTTLLEGARHKMSVGYIDKAVETAIKHDVIDTAFVNSLLSSVFDSAVNSARRQKIHSPQIVPVFGAMLHYYSQLFYMEPLQHLIPIDLADAAKVGPHMPHRWEAPAQLFPVLDKVVASKTEKTYPTGTTLAIMYIAYVKSLSKASSVLSLYSYMRLLILRGNRVCATFIGEKDTLLHDVIIARLCEHPGMLRAALDVVGDMLKEKAARQDAAPASSSKRETPHPIPSSYTWNILLQGFMAHKETAPGERILSMMQENGVSPNLVTWNTLLSGYARTHNAGKVMDTLRKLEENNLQANEYTMRAFARAARKRSVLRQLEMAMSPEPEIPMEDPTESAQPAVPLA